MLEKMADFFENRLDGYDEHMMSNIEAAEELQEFDPRIWLEIVEKATIYHDKRIVFTFQDGKEVASYFLEVA